MRCVRNRKISKLNRSSTTIYMIHRNTHMTSPWFVYTLRSIQVSVNAAILLHGQRLHECFHFRRFRQPIVFARWRLCVRRWEFGRKKWNHRRLGCVNVAQYIRVRSTAMAAIANHGHSKMCSHLCEIQRQFSITDHYHRKSTLCSRSHQSRRLPRYNASSWQYCDSFAHDSVFDFYAQAIAAAHWWMTIAATNDTHWLGWYHLDHECVVCQAFPVCTPEFHHT